MICRLHPLFNLSADGRTYVKNNASQGSANGSATGPAEGLRRQGSASWPGNRRQGPSGRSYKVGLVFFT